VKLTDEDREAIDAGRLELRRPVKYRYTRKLRCGIKRGTVVQVDDSRCISVTGVRSDGDEWIIQFEVLGLWALKSIKERKVGREQIAAELPGVITYDHEPDLIVGDIFEFPNYREKIRDPNGDFPDRKNEQQEGGDPINEDVPGLYIQITSITRDKKGKWIARYCKHGFEEDEYMAPQLGYTKNPDRAISKAPVYRGKPDPAIAERDDAAREVRRLEALRAGLQQKLMTTSNPRKQVVVVKAIEDTERKLRAVQGKSERIAA
jgi:hypothetical protein